MNATTAAPSVLLAHRVVSLRCDATIRRLSGSDRYLPALMAVAAWPAGGWRRRPRGEPYRRQPALRHRRHFVRGDILGEQPVLIAEILHLGDMQHRIIGFAFLCVFLAIEKRQE